MAVRLVLTLAWLLAGAAVVWTARYDGYKVIRAVPNNAQQLLQLRTLQKDSFVHGLDVWKGARTINETMDIMISSLHAHEIGAILNSHGIKHEVIISDVQRLINDEIIHPSKKRAVADDVLTVYSSYSKIVAWLEQIAQTCGSRCSLETIGFSALGLPLKVIKITGSDQTTNKKAIFVDGTMHAREWISTTMALNIIYKLVGEYTTDPTTKRIVDTFDWYVFPVVNPDGYEYSRNTDRMWRKTRGTTSKKTCPGTDLNRNFDFHWLESDSSTNPCDDTFAGATPFSEPESQALREYLVTLLGRVEMYMTLHSYGQYWLYSWGYSTVQVPDYLELKSVATIGANAIKAASSSILSPTRYTVGSAAGALYPSAGGSDDWAKGVAGIKYSYTIELPPGDSALAGFMLSETKIPQVVKETWAGIKAVATELTARQPTTVVG